jgi:hypothetical protein
MKRGMCEKVRALRRMKRGRCEKGRALARAKASIKAEL